MSTLPNSLGVACRAERLVTAHSDNDLISALRHYGSDLVLLGGRSNVVLPQRLQRPVCLVATRGIESRADGRDVLVTAKAGENWHGLVRRTLGNGLFGLENLALIPGSVGAAPIQNIGAYGVELAERTESVRVFDRVEGEVRRLSPRDCGFDYRTSVFRREPEHYAILDVTLRLDRCGRRVLGYPDVARELRRQGWPKPNPRQVAEAVIRIRRRKLPDLRLWGNVGSFFKNPVVSADEAEHLARSVPDLVRHAVGLDVKLAAAQLIDLCGWKGYHTGAVEVWRRQPLVLVNRGGASADDFLGLARALRESVLQRWGVTLELEPTVIPAE